ncbi:GntR family transcriptional regulator [Desulfosporosinus fructosivorans]|uniref:GntR family transcriptional regulator n=1 Tax=Desulfosporosinus fructosivorans TaxID=2018669 RepID=A0A4Z0R741_9FIRM|nr:GntR family transcriptional regulator [Desulfosporosinus fructosivorans]TGE37476.1 GntR family transcriptional regulator [Desulfosporosinus fructosivorans]
MKTNRDFMPVYYQLADDLKQQIESGELKPGDAVPSESQLVGDYGISRVTVRRGLAILLEAGLIETVRGIGNFVAKPKLNQVTLTFQEKDSLEEHKLNYQLLEVKRISADDITASKLGVFKGTKVFRIRRLIHGDNGPVGIDMKYLPYIKGQPMLENEIEYADFPAIVAKHTNITIHKIEMRISATPLSAEEAELLKTVAGHPALCVYRAFYAKDGTTLGFSKTIYRGESFELSGVSYPYSAKV